MDGVWAKILNTMQYIVQKKRTLIINNINIYWIRHLGYSLENIANQTNKTGIWIHIPLRDIYSDYNCHHGLCHHFVHDYVGTGIAFWHNKRLDSHPFFFYGHPSHSYISINLPYERFSKHHFDNRVLQGLQQSVDFFTRLLEFRYLYLRIFRSNTFNADIYRPSSLGRANTTWGILEGTIVVGSKPDDCWRICMVFLLEQIRLNK